MKKNKSFLYFFIGIFAFGKAANLTDETRLLQTLLTDYNTDARPVTSSSQQATVSLAMYLLRFHEINTQLQYISVVGYVTAEWKDERLTWNSSEYGGLDYIAIAPSKLWLPNIALGNTASGTPINSNWYSLFKARVYSDGVVQWSPGGSFQADCQMDVTYFPFDDQICEFVFQTWVYTTDKVSLTYTSKAADEFLDYYNVKNGEWDVVQVNVVRRDRTYETTSFSEVHFGIKCSRKPLFYVTNIILLSVLLALLVLLMFKLPPESGERISMGVTLLLAFSVFILMIDSTIPDVSVPLIIVYLICFMALTTLGVAESVLILYCHHYSGKNRPPKWARFTVFHVVGRCLCEKEQTRVEPETKSGETGTNKKCISENGISDGYKVKGNDISEDKKEGAIIKDCSADDSPTSIAEEWHKMAVIIDKFCFWLCLGLFGFLMLVLIIIIPLAQPDDTLQWAGF